MRRLALSGLLFAFLAATSSGATPAAPPPVSPESFFTGRTEGTGTIKMLFSSAHAVHVHSEGRMLPDGSLIINQNVDEEGKPLRVRQWHLRRTGKSSFGGSLSDATGPVRGDVAGNLLHLSYPMKGVQAEQWIAMAPDGRSAQNRMTIRKFGMTVATLEETIRKTG